MHVASGAFRWLAGEQGGARSCWYWLYRWGRITHFDILVHFSVAAGVGTGMSVGTGTGTSVGTGAGTAVGAGRLLGAGATEEAGAGGPSSVIPSFAITGSSSLEIAAFSFLKTSTFGGVAGRLWLRLRLRLGLRVRCVGSTSISWCGDLRGLSLSEAGSSSSFSKSLSGVMVGDRNGDLREEGLPLRLRL